CARRLPHYYAMDYW
nr:immunoglobulin heavy chain junction region [Mus musculus]